MSQEYWQKQGQEPLFSNLLWSRPETRRGAGKLLIIGGQAQEFANVAECYAAAERAGAGTIRVLMPDSTRKLTGNLPNIEYAPSNQSGSFAREALDTLLDASQWADGVLMAGDLGKNSETSLMLENFLLKYAGPLLITSDSRTSLPITYKDMLSRENTILIINLSGLQKMAAELKLTDPITSASGNTKLAETLHTISMQHPATIVYLQNDTAWASFKSRVSSTPSQAPENSIATSIAVWFIQNPLKIFESATTALFELNNKT
jgi:NAD(P)H-hydrate repair Nnr-like enzyme with NAD(P)H-hydrate dehydratase domain